MVREIFRPNCSPQASLPIKVSINSNTNDHSSRLPKSVLAVAALISESSIHTGSTKILPTNTTRSSLSTLNTRRFAVTQESTGSSTPCIRYATSCRSCADMGLTGLQHRESRGLTATGKKSRGLGKGHRYTKTTAGRRKTWKRLNTLSLWRYR